MKEHIVDFKECNETIGVKVTGINKETKYHL